MPELDTLLSSFFQAPNREQAEETETLERFDLFYSGTPKAVLDRSEILQVLESFEALAGAWTLRVKLSGQESPHSFRHDTKANWNSALDELIQDHVGSAVDHLKIVLERQNKPVLRVMNPAKLNAWLCSLNLDDLLMSLQESCPMGRPLTLVHSSFTPSFGSKLIRFSTEPLSPVDWLTDREKLALSRRELIVSDWSELPYFAQDFIWKGSDDHLLRGCFSRLENFFAVLSLADGSNKKQFGTDTGPLGGMAIRVRGHRMREQDIAWRDIPTKPDITLRGIDDWCYHTGGAGPLSDKLGLARNFVSLHWEATKRGIFGMSPRVVRAVRDGYQLYLKRNLKEYVELRGKVISSILELDGKASRAIETAASNLEKNFYGVVTYAVTTVLAKAISDKTLDSSLPSAVATVGLVLVGLSGLHALYARDAALNELSRAKEVYEELRQQYSEFFDPLHFDSVFGTENNSPMTKMDSYVKGRLRKLMWIWGGTLVVLGIVILKLARWN